MAKQSSHDGPVFDLCVVGAGPVGLALALAYAKRGRSVVLLESGGVSPKERAGREIEAASFDPARHAPMADAVCRALGGTSHWWGGRCVPYDPTDFEPRSWVEARWPIGFEDVAPWYGPAADFLSCGAPDFASPSDRWDGLENVSARDLERWAQVNNAARLHADELKRSNIELRLRHTALDLVLSPDERSIEAVRVHTPQGPEIVRARRYALAMGGLETTRFLLSVQRAQKRLFGGPNGALGKYYAGHISGKISKLVLHDSKSISDFDIKKDASGAYVRRRFTIDPEIQRRESLLNIAFWPDNPPFQDARHRNGLLSLVYLALSFKPLGRRLLPEAIRVTHTSGSASRYLDHVGNVLKDPIGCAGELAAVVHKRFLSQPRCPTFLSSNKGGVYALHYHAEQAPCSESRVWLGNTVDEFGTPKLVINLQYSEQDAESVLRAHRILDGSLRAAGFAELQYSHPEAERLSAILQQAQDGFHQTGTARMGSDPRNSVVDSDCKVHGLDNLHLATSAVLPTSGQANPTFTTVALAFRLAAHLAQAQGTDVPSTLETLEAVEA